MLIPHLIVQLCDICSFRRCQLTSGNKSLIVRLWELNLPPNFSFSLLVKYNVNSIFQTFFCINSLCCFSHICHDGMDYSENLSHSKFWLLYAFRIEYCHRHSKSNRDSIVVNLCMHVAIQNTTSYLNPKSESFLLFVPSWHHSFLEKLSPLLLQFSKCIQIHLSYFTLNVLVILPIYFSTKSFYI